MTRSNAGIAMLACLTMAATGCSGTFGGVSRSIRISEGANVSAQTSTPIKYRAVVGNLGLAEEIFAKQLEALSERRNSLRSRRRTLTVATYATFAATTLVISAAAIRSAGNAMAGTDEGLRTAGYGALGGLGLGTTLEVVNLMQEDPAAVEAKITNLVNNHNSMVTQLNDVFADGVARDIDAETIRSKVTPIIEAFINAAVQINVKG